MMTFLNLTTGIFWGELSFCEKSLKAAQYSCDNTVAYGAVSAFAVLLFLTQLVFTIGLVVFRGEFINEAGLYDEVSQQHSAGGFVYTAPPNLHVGTKPPPSADL
jgi:hypothetical protein